MHLTDRDEVRRAYFLAAFVILVAVVSPGIGLAEVSDVGQPLYDTTVTWWQGKLGKFVGLAGIIGGIIGLLVSKKFTFFLIGALVGILAGAAIGMSSFFMDIGTAIFPTS